MTPFDAVFSPNCADNAATKLLSWFKASPTVDNHLAIASWFEQLTPYLESLGTGAVALTAEDSNEGRHLLKSS